ncbi:unnamed protein product [Blepharisma stoltei]|uniref:Alpha-tubulin N-acetyltransferase n=1 Tax=Blepharisma stoltei TaxID=1481888 RepID=A0AAU9JIC7_9CILI|nr:unnamed protein product [Blepharisma stoltei]
MEFKFDLNSVLRPDSRGIAILAPNSQYRPSRELCFIIDELGKLSATAQGLRAIITTSTKFFGSNDNKLYFKTEGNRVLGMLKTGYRKLFYTNEIGKITELTPLCLLDFYVHESVQRSGYGKELYERMIYEENSQPNKIAIDRPSPKLLSFMRKHYGLSEFVPQNNNFTIYKRYFNGGFQESDGNRRKTPISRNREPDLSYGEPVVNNLSRERKLQEQFGAGNIFNDSTEIRRGSNYQPRAPFATEVPLRKKVTTSAASYGSYI